MDNINQNDQWILEASGTTVYCTGATRYWHTIKKLVPVPCRVNMNILLICETFFGVIVIVTFFVALLSDGVVSYRFKSKSEFRRHFFGPNILMKMKTNNLHFQHG